MADSAQLRTLTDTVAQLRADLNARNNEVTALQDNLRDRDRAIQEIRDHIKDQDLREKQLRQHIELLEDQLKAVSLPGGVATHVASTVTGVTPVYWNFTVINIVLVYT
jgi:chromosome segregation ATPase